MEFLGPETNSLIKLSITIFFQHSDEILKAFSNFKLDDIKPVSASQTDCKTTMNEQHVYFAKYLTNPKVQESDS